MHINTIILDLYLSSTTFKGHSRDQVLIIIENEESQSHVYLHNKGIFSLILDPNFCAPGLPLAIRNTWLRR